MYEKYYIREKEQWYKTSQFRNLLIHWMPSRGFQKQTQIQKINNFYWAISLSYNVNHYIKLHKQNNAAKCSLTQL